jgi:hypothetical protein
MMILSRKNGWSDGVRGATIAPTSDPEFWYAAPSR